MKSDTMGDWHAGGTGCIRPPEFGLNDEMVEITSFNRGITLSTSDGERVRRINRVLCKMDKLGKD